MELPIFIWQVCWQTFGQNGQNIFREKAPAFFSIRKVAFDELTFCTTKASYFDRQVDASKEYIREVTKVSKATNKGQEDEKNQIQSCYQWMWQYL